MVKSLWLRDLFKIQIECKLSHAHNLLYNDPLNAVSSRLIMIGDDCRLGKVSLYRTNSDSSGHLADSLLTGELSAI